MNESSKLPIEDNQDLLAEYGRAFAWINLVEYMLEQIISFKGKLHLINSNLRLKLLDKKTLGSKIVLAEELLDKELMDKLKLLNTKRVLLAHNAISQEINIVENKQVKGDLIVGFGEKKEKLTINFVKEIIILSQSIVSDLHSVFTKNNV